MILSVHSTSPVLSEIVSNCVQHFNELYQLPTTSITFFKIFTAGIVGKYRISYMYKFSFCLL